MANNLGFSDSQESVFLDPALITEITQDSLSVLEECDFNLFSQNKSDLKVEMNADNFDGQNETPKNTVSNFQQQRNDTTINLREEIPLTEEHAGPFHFELRLVPQVNSRHWTYCDKLQKVFIDMEKTLPLRFKWTPSIDGLWVRSTMVFSHEQYRNEPVMRCHNHMAADTKLNVNFHQNPIKHVVRCTNSASIYMENAGGHLSVLTPMGIPQDGCDYVQANYQFYCKNSCNSGMNRRPTELIFTLEDEMSNIYGRRKLLVRVCSCPKRDKEKEGNEIQGKSETAEKKPVGKKRKLAVNGAVSQAEDREVCQVQFDVPGKNMRQAIMKMAYNMLAGQQLQSGNPELNKHFLKKLMEKMEKSDA